MGASEFDRLSRALAGGAGRRDLLKFAGAAVAASVLGFVGRGTAIARDQASGPIAARASGPRNQTCDIENVGSAELSAAEAALAEGALEATLSADGCVVYRQTPGVDGPSHEEMVIGDVLAMTWDHIDTESLGRYDADLDGFVEHQVRSFPGDDGLERVEAMDFDPTTKQPTRRVTYTVEGEVVHAVVELPGEDGTLQVVGGFDLPLYQEALLAAGGAASQSGCTAQQANELRQRAREAFVGDGTTKGGIECVRGKAKKLLMDLVRAFVRFNSFVSLSCADLSTGSGGLQRLARTTWYPIGASPVEVNTSTFFSMTPQQQRQLLFHEFLHAEWEKNHDPAIEADPATRDEKDQIYACAAMCFDPNASKCSCAACLGTDTCDERCKGFGACRNPELDLSCGEVCCENTEICLNDECCLSDRVCGDVCCEQSGTCGSSAECCPTDRQCEAVCCQPGEQCVNGQCADPCGGAPGTTACRGECCPDGFFCCPVPTKWLGFNCAPDGEICCPDGESVCGGVCWDSGGDCERMHNGEYCRCPRGKSCANPGEYGHEEGTCI